MPSTEALLRQRLFSAAVKCLDSLCALHEIEVIAMDASMSAERRLSLIKIEIEEYGAIAFMPAHPDSVRGRFAAELSYA